MGVLWFVLVFSFGLWIGFLLRAWIAHRERYSGTILITHSEEKTLYSLELDEYPESIELKKQVVFKVDASDVDLNRD
jgi:hypothetical protein